MRGGVSRLIDRFLTSAPKSFILLTSVKMLAVAPGKLVYSVVGVRRKTLMPDWLRSLVSSRTLSLLIAIAYLVIACVSEGSTPKIFATLLIVGGALLLPLACIWFADE